MGRLTRGRVLRVRTVYLNGGNDWPYLGNGLELHQKKARDALAYLRFFRRVRIAPGLTLNLSKHGASLSAGVRGAHVTVGRNGLRRTVGLPGTGIYYTSQHGWHSGVHTAPHFRNGQTAPPNGISNKSLFFTLCLCALLGLFGVHQFYVGHVIRGLIMLVLTVMGWGLVITVPWVIFDLILIAIGQFHDERDCRIAW